jgi:hypothetical protein
MVEEATKNMRLVPGRARLGVAVAMGVGQYASVQGVTPFIPLGDCKAKRVMRVRRVCSCLALTLLRLWKVEGGRAQSFL